MASPGEPISGPARARDLRGTIQGYVRAGQSLSATLDGIRDLYEQVGTRFTAATENSVRNQFAMFKDLEVRSQSLSHVRGDIAITDRWLSYATLERSLAEFNDNPTYMVRYRVRGSLDGAEVDRWKTATYAYPVPLPTTVGELQDDLEESSLETDTESLSGAELAVSEVAIYAV